jgi:hypothetical protein
MLVLNIYCDGANLLHNPFPSILKTKTHKSPTTPPNPIRIMQQKKIECDEYVINLLEKKPTLNY